MKTRFDKPITAIAIDYGTRNIGMAVGQSLTATATELPALRYSATAESLRVLQAQIAGVIAEWRPALIVIGWPLNMDGSESPMCAEVKHFGEQLAGLTGKTVVYMDERLTSHEAKAGLEDQKRDFKKQPIDSAAAKLLLESWFRQQHT